MYSPDFIDSHFADLKLEAIFIGHSVENFISSVRYSIDVHTLLYSGQCRVYHTTVRAKMYRKYAHRNEHSNQISMYQYIKIRKIESKMKKILEMAWKRKMIVNWSHRRCCYNFHVELEVNLLMRMLNGNGVLKVIYQNIPGYTLKDQDIVAPIELLLMQEKPHILGLAEPWFEKLDRDWDGYELVKGNLKNGKKIRLQF